MKRRIKISLIATGGMLLLLGGFAATLITPLKEQSAPPLPNPNAFDYFMKAREQMAREGVDIDHMGRSYPHPWTLAEKQKAIDDNKAALTTFRSGLAYEYVCPLPKYELAPYPKLRSVARLVVADGLVAAEHKEWNRAANAYIDVIQLGRKIGGVWIGPGVENMGKWQLWDQIEHLNASETHAALARLEALAARRLSFSEILQEEFSGVQAQMNEGHSRAMKNLMTVEDGGSPFSPDRLSSIGKSLMFLVCKEDILRNLQKENDQNIANVKKPFRERVQIQTKYSEYSTPESYEDTHLELLSNFTTDTLIRTRLALHAYRLEKGMYPKDLNALVKAGYLKSVPIDPFLVDKPLHYRLDGVKYLLYSVAADGKDDNGKIIDNPNTQFKSARHQILADSKGDFQRSFYPY